MNYQAIRTRFVGIALQAASALVIALLSTGVAAAQSGTSSAATMAQLGAPPPPPPPLATGVRMPGFVTTTLQGRPFHSQSLLGHVTVLDFWATWCVTCKMDMPGIQKIYKQFEGRGVRVLGMSLDTYSVDLVGPTVKQIGVTYPILVNSRRNAQAGRDFNADVLPCVYIVDKHGIVRWSYSGDYANEDADISKLVGKLLRES